MRPTPAEAHRLFDVLRLRDGETVVVFDGQGRQALARVKRAPTPLLVLTGRAIPAATPPREVILIQAVPKGPRMDWIVEKATELGAAAIVPVMTERVVVRLDGRAGEERVARWQRLAAAACRQCGGSRVPRIERIGDLRDALARAHSLDAFLVGSLAEAARPVREVLAGRRVLRRVGLLIGPEGDLTPAETDQVVQAGGLSVRLGGQVLRAETAAVAGLAIVMDELDCRGAGDPG